MVTLSSGDGHSFHNITPSYDAVICEPACLTANTLSRQQLQKESTAFNTHASSMKLQNKIKCFNTSQKHIIGRQHEECKGGHVIT